MIKTTASPRLKSPILICAWPGMGEVAIKAATQLKEALPFKEFARLDTPEFYEPSSIFVKEGILEMPNPAGGIFYYCKDPRRTRDIVLFTSDMQPNTGSAAAYATEIVRFARKCSIKAIYTFAAMSVPIDHSQVPKVWIAATSKKVLQGFKAHNLKLLREGQISGLNGLILGVAKGQKIDGVCLLGEIPIYTIQIENPKASIAVLEVLDRSLGLGLDLTPMRQRAKFVEEEINKLIGYIKGESPVHTPLSEEEIEKIKHELGAFTKLPESAHKKIEELFTLAAEDLTRATELKKELDTWIVFKDYEDRFLDLFKKKKTDQ